MKHILNFWKKIYDGHALLAISGAFFGLLFLLFLVLGFSDERLLMGVNVWLKPGKFALSGIIFNWTIALLLPIYFYSFKKRKIIGNILASAMTVEIAVIAIQAARGEMSHYNTSTPLNGILFGFMGIGIATIACTVLLLAVDSFRKKLNTSLAINWSIRLAWLALLFSFLGGQMMIGNMSHAVGVEDGGAGLPITNWSTEGGDLRVMHFLGLHAIQVLPLLTIGFNKLINLKNKDRLIYFTFISGILYFSFQFFTWWQAINGIPFSNLYMFP